MDELARRYAETHDPKIKAEIEELNHRLAALPVALFFWQFPPENTADTARMMFGGKLTFFSLLFNVPSVIVHRGNDSTKHSW
jgi:hypothetical protein